MTIQIAINKYMNKQGPHLTTPTKTMSRWIKDLKVTNKTFNLVGENTDYFHCLRLEEGIFIKEQKHQTIKEMIG